MGLSLRNVSVSIWVNAKKKRTEFGEMLFAHFGLTGPVILALSGAVVDCLREKSEVEISIDLKPALDDRKLDARLQRDLAEHGKKRVPALLKGLLPRKLIPVCINQLGLSPEKTCCQITGGERRKLRLWLKDFRFTITGHRPLSEAIVTAGGISVNDANNTGTSTQRRAHG